MPSDNTPIVVIALIFLVSMIYLFTDSPTHNQGALQPRQRSRQRTPDRRSRSSDNDSDDSDYSSDGSSFLSSHNSAGSVHPADAHADDSVSENSVATIASRAMGRNNLYYKRKDGGRYHHVSYRAEGEDLRGVDKDFYKVPDVTKNYTDRYAPMDEADPNLAPITVSNKKDTEKDKYNVNSFLPQEEEKDWFETIETVDVKNSHLINIYKPIGVNTIGSSQKNATYDLRGTDKAVCPKFVVSPWLQSSIEPDRSMKSLC